MQYYLDTEFIDHAKQARVLGFPIGKPVPTTDLISIGIVAEDGSEYYAVCNEFDLDAAWKDAWVRSNVLRQIHAELSAAQGPYVRTHHYALYEPFTKSSIKTLLKWSGKTRYQIRQEVNDFCDADPVFFGYYADYDWVVLCHLFGRMIDLPVRFPKFCQDLKGLMEYEGFYDAWKDYHCPDPVGEHNALVDARWNKKLHEALTKAVRLK